jgi:hypothetical protein
MGGVSRPSLPLLAAFALVSLAAGCGAPPQPLPTSPPRAVGSAAEPSSSAGAPPLGGTLPPGALPTGGINPGLTPGITPGGATPPAGAGYTMPTIPVVPTTPTTTPPPAAPTCTAGPTKAQVVALVKGKPGIPTEPLEVRFGPYCSGTWQFTILGIVGKNPDTAEPMLVVSSGKPAKLKLVEAGADVCSDKVFADAPPGIRVRACGS